MLNIKSALGDLVERATSTGWQAAAGYVIAVDVFHDPTLSIPIAAALSAVKSGLLWFYGKHKQEISADVAAVDASIEELRPILQAIAAEVRAQQAAEAGKAVAPPAPVVPLNPPPPAAAQSNTVVLPELPTAAAPGAEKLPPFMHHPAQ